MLHLAHAHDQRGTGKILLRAASVVVRGWHDVRADRGAVAVALVEACRAVGRVGDDMPEDPRAFVTVSEFNRSPISILCPACTGHISMGARGGIELV